MDRPVVAVIMAGGAGERFWPVSRKKRPKQLLKLASETDSMLEEAVNRLRPIVSDDRIFIATNTQLVEPVKKSISSVPPENIIGEPHKRNTAGCLVFSIAHILARFGEEAKDYLMSVTTADHLIGDGGRFKDTVIAGLTFAHDNDALITIGVHPTRPETGYGYIEINQLNKPFSEFQSIPIYKVERFLEKPSLDDAERYQASRFYYWNSGMFFWKISTFLNELRKAEPILADGVDRLTDAIRKEPDNEESIARIFESLPDISIDYALMEKADNVFAALGDFRWDDVGAWDSLARIRRRDDNRNTPIGDPVLIDCKNVVVYNEPGKEKMAVCVIGMEDTIVVSTNDGILVCANDRAQNVKDAVRELKKQDSMFL